jgi:hypothetical protein
MVVTNLSGELQVVVLPTTEVIDLACFSIDSIIITILASFLSLGRVFYLAVFFYTFAANACFLVSPARFASTRHTKADRLAAALSSPSLSSVR